MILGITGGTGCGKTTLLKEIEARGGLVLDCDAVYHELLTRDHALLNAINDRFPGVVVDKKLERKKLGAIVFADEQALMDLNAITHGAIKAEIVRRLSENPKLAAIDAIALFEGGLAELCHTTVAITAPRDARIQRLMKRDGISAQYAENRINAQKSEDWFRQMCEHTLHNDGTPEEFQRKCSEFLDSIL